jgi:hypothetical protein
MISVLTQYRSGPVPKKKYLPSGEIEAWPALMSSPCSAMSIASPQVPSGCLNDTNRWLPASMSNTM